MLTKADIARIREHQDRKTRDQSGLFVAEGVKLVRDLLDAGLRADLIAMDPSGAAYFREGVPQGVRVLPGSPDQLARASSMKAPQGVIALFHKPDQRFDPVQAAQDDIVFLLDGLQNPGNMGTILRTADWFGFRHIVATPETVDLFNPKVVQATMGALARVRVLVADIRPILQEVRDKTHLPVAGTFMEGSPVHQGTLPRAGIVIIGNEGAGISGEWTAFLTHRWTIPSYGQTASSPESLNAAVAASILMAEMRRQHRA